MINEPIADAVFYRRYGICCGNMSCGNFGKIMKEIKREAGNFIIKCPECNNTVLLWENSLSFHIDYKENNIEIVKEGK